MPITVSGQKFYSATEVADEIAVARQTLWRWRNAGKIPAGSRYRDRQILFTKEELEKIRLFANMIEPASPKKAR